MPNPSGRNGYNNGIEPHNLAEILQEYVSEGHSLELRLRLLASDHKYNIAEMTLKKLNKKYRISSARKPPPCHITTTLIANQMSNNVTSSNGPNTIKKRIALQQNIVLPRRIVRETMYVLDPSSSAHRFLGKRPQKERGTLTDSGIYYEVHFDGHEKLNFKALRMGSVGIDIYGSRCHGSGFLLFARVVPNARCVSTVAHLYLDMVEDRQEIPVQVTVDKGTETEWMFTLHENLRAKFLPDTPSTEIPACVALKSSDNIPIESLWSYHLKFNGHDLKAAILLGKQENYFNPAFELHVDLFNWIWPKIVQTSIDLFTQYWNSHKVRKQSTKALPSGVSPMEVFKFPENFQLCHGGIPVDPTYIQQLRELIPIPRDECFRWVSDEFEEQAQWVYQLLGSPELSITSGWTVFLSMLKELDSE